MEGKPRGKSEWDALDSPPLWDGYQDRPNKYSSRLVSMFGFAFGYRPTAGLEMQLGVAPFVRVGTQFLWFQRETKKNKHNIGVPGKRRHPLWMVNGSQKEPPGGVGPPIFFV